MFELEPNTCKSSAKLQRFTGAIAGHISTLETLGHIPNWGPFIVHLIVTKLYKSQKVKAIIKATIRLRVIN